MEPLLMMRPPLGFCAFMMRIASWVHMNIATRLMFTTSRNFSIGRSSIGTAGAPMPALLKRTSSLPHLDRISLKTLLTSASLVRSAGSTMARSFAPDSAAVQAYAVAVLEHGQRGGLSDAGPGARDDRNPHGFLLETGSREW